MKKRFLLIVLMILSSFFVMTSCSESSNDDSTTQSTEAYHTVIFKNYDDTILLSKSVKHGTGLSSTTINNIKPTRPNDDDYSYTFSSWSPSISNRITSDVVYVAQYDKTPLPYKFIFNLNGGVCDSGISDKKTNRLDKADFKFDLHKGNNSFRGWEYNGTLIFNKNGALMINANRFEFASEMVFDALYENEYHVTVNAKVSGTTYQELPSEIGTISQSSFYPAHGDVVVSATPKSGYKFDGWYKGSSRVSSNSTYSFTLWEEDVILTARFSLNSYGLIVRTENSEFGDIQVKGYDAMSSSNTTHMYNEFITIYARKKSNIDFLGWYDNDGNFVSNNETYTFDMPNKNYLLIARWNYFNINYDLDGGDNNPNNPTYYNTYMSNITLLEPTKEGYRFDGWEYNGEIVDAIDTSMAKDIILIAKYTPLQYQINLDSIDGIISDGSVTISYDSTYVLPVPTKEGHRFLGWYCDDVKMTDENGNSINAYRFISNKTYIAKYTPLQYQLTFDGNGGQFDNKDIYQVTFDDNYIGGSTKIINLGFNEKLEYPKMPTRDGYYFSGWYLESSCKNAYLFNDIINDDFTLYAKWVSLPTNTDLMFGMAAYENDFYNYFYYDPAGYTLSRPDYILLQAHETGTHIIYYRSGTSKDSASSSSLYKIGISIINLSTSKTILANTTNTLGWKNVSFTTNVGDVICIGLYRNNAYDVYAHLAFEGFTKENSTAKTSSTIGINYNDEINYPNISRTGYTFAGWYLNDELFESNTWNISSNGTLEATWSPNNYQITYDVNGGKELFNNVQTVTYDSNYSLIIPERVGYEFVGWYDSNNNLVQDGTWTIADNCLLTANWNIINYDITYNLNDGINNESNPTSYNYESDTIILSEPTKEGYTFLGWTNEDILTPDKNVLITKNSIGEKTFTANWAPNTYEITYDVNGGDAITNNKQQVIFDSEFVLITPERTGYAFTGWYYNDDLVDATIWEIADNVTLKAGWIANTNTKYVVNHYQENINDDNYTFFESETLYGSSDTSVTPNVKQYKEGSNYSFISPTKETIVISPDGTTVLNYYYKRAKYTLNYYTTGGNAIASQEFKQGFALSLPDAVRSNYTFGGWYLDASQSNEFNLTIMPCKDVNVYAYWVEETKCNEFTFNGQSLSKFVGDSTNIVIPKYYGNVLIKSISSNAFMNAKNIVSINIPETVTSIGSGIFGGCTSLENITIPRANNFVDLFRRMNAPTTESTEVTVVRSSTSSSGASSINYYGVPKSLRNITITNVTTIPENTFKDFSMITNVTIPNDVTSIGAYAFYKCSSLKFVNRNDNGIVIPSTCTEIGAFAFYNNINIEYVNLSNVEIIGNYAFYNCNKVIEYSFNNEIITIGEYSFYDNNSLVRFNSNVDYVVNIPNTCTKIGIDAFANAKLINTFNIPETVTSIGSGIFGGCISLENITIPRANNFVDLFRRMNAPTTESTEVTVVRSSTSSSGASSINYYGVPKSLRNITITNVTTIPENTFKDFSMITNVTIPNDVTSIGAYAFANCKALVSINIPENCSYPETAFYNCSSLILE